MDACRPNALDGGWVAHGWLIGGRPLRRCAALLADGVIAEAHLGLARPDLAAAFPERAHAARAGFLIGLPGEPEASPTPTECWLEDELGEWRRVSINWSIRHPAALPLESAPAAPPPVIARESAAAQGRGDAIERQFRLALAASSGVTLRLDIINKCNLRCIMCHYREDDVFRRPAQHLRTEQFQEMFDALGPVVGEVMLSCADEPLTSRHFSEIVRYLRAARPGVLIKFCTNAMLMTAPIRRLLVEQQVDQILISLDGCTRATLESIRVGAVYDRVIAHVLALDELRRRAGSARPELVFDFVMMRRNLHESLPFVAMVRRLGGAAIDFRHLVDSYDRFQLHGEQLVREPGRFNFYRERLLAAGREHGVALYLPPPFADAPEWTPSAAEPAATLADFESVAATFSPDALTEPLRVVARPEADAARVDLRALYGDTFCPRPFSEIMLREQDEVMPCPWHREALGRLSSAPRLLDTFLGERFQALRRNMLTPAGDPNCRVCPLKSKELPSDKFG